MVCYGRGIEKTEMRGKTDEKMERERDICDEEREKVNKISI